MVFLRSWYLKWGAVIQMSKNMGVVWEPIEAGERASEVTDKKVERILVSP